MISPFQDYPAPSPGLQPPRGSHRVAVAPKETMTTGRTTASSRSRYGAQASTSAGVGAGLVLGRHLAALVT
jgi:hypothetical protein